VDSMNQSELRAAAERVIKRVARYFDSDARKVAIAYLAAIEENKRLRELLHPADSDEAITEDWLRSIGFDTCTHWGALNIGDWHNSIAVEWDFGKWSLGACRKAGDRCDFIHKIPAPRTRGDVRRLLSALGITTKPAAALGQAMEER
jgi:hypothetical protein